MKKIIFTILIIFAGCQSQNQDFQDAKNNLSNTKINKEVSFANKEIKLLNDKYKGALSFFSKNIKKTDEGFLLPVFASDISKEDMIDTITLSLSLNDDIKLKSVISPEGFTTATEKINTKKPVIHFYSSAVSKESYQTISSSEKELFTLVFSGEAIGNILIGGYFFDTSGKLLKTNKERLLLADM